MIRTIMLILDPDPGSVTFYPSRIPDLDPQHWCEPYIFLCLEEECLGLPKGLGRRFA